MTEYLKLWEYDKPIDLSLMLNHSPGVWSYKVTPKIVTITDDYSITGYYQDTNIAVYNIKSVVVDQVQYSKVNSIIECENTNLSFYYNYSTTFIYIHFVNDKSTWGVNDISLGAVVGFCSGVIGDNKPYLNDIFYEPRVSNIFNIKKSKDPLFYGLLKYTTGSVSCQNEDGFFDDWRDRNLFAQASRILIGEKDDTYANYDLVFQGLIENDSRSWTDFTVKLQDPRKGLTQSIATNLLTKTLYPSLPDDNVDKPKPIKYGIQKNSPCMCLNETASGGKHTFLLADTEFNAVASLTTVYLQGKPVSVDSSDLTAGTVTLLASASVTIDGDSVTVAENLDGITADFVAGTIVNGVDIIKDLMYRYDYKNYTSTFWDTTETAASQLLARDTSVSVDDDKALQKVIEQICIDIDGIFFFKDSGVYTIRLYDANRSITKVIKQDEWLGQPTIDNNGSEFLSSVIIKYNHNLADNRYEQYENTNYKAEVFDTYKTYKTTTIETNLTSLADAQAKSESIMSISKLVGDIVTRSIPYCTDVEIMDFIVCAPMSRLYYKNGVAIVPEYGVYEVIGINKNLDSYEIDLTLRFVRDYTMPIDTVFSVLIDESGNFIIDESGNTILMRG